MIRKRNMVQLRDITLSDATKAVVETALGVTLVLGEVVGEGAVEGVAEILVSAILTHAEAVAGNDGLAKSVVRAARCAGEVLTSLRDADFPEQHFSAYFGVLETLAKIRVWEGKWTGMSWCKKAFSISVHTRQSNAIKYKKEFEAMNALLCVYLGQLSDAVLAETFAGVQDAKKLLAEAAAASGVATTAQALSVERLQELLLKFAADRATFEDQLDHALEGMQAELAAGNLAAVAAAEKAAAMAEAAAATFLGGGAVMAPEAAAELRNGFLKELLEGVVPVLLQSLADEGKLTREQVKASAAEVKAEIGSLRGELDAKIDMVTFLSPSPPLVFILAR